MKRILHKLVEQVRGVKRKENSSPVQDIHFGACDIGMATPPLNSEYTVFRPGIYYK